MISVKDIDESLINDGIHPETGQPLTAPQAMNQRAMPANQGASRLAGAGNSIENMAIGAGDALQNFFADVGNIALPKGNNLSGVNLQLPKAHLGDDSLSYKVGRGAGDVISFVGGGEVADTLRAGMEGAPLVGKLAQSLGGDGMRGVARRAVGTGTYGAVTNPDHRVKGFAEGAALSPVLDLLPAGANMVTSPFKAKDYAGKIIDELGEGKSLEDNAKSLAKSVKDAYEKQKAEGSELYDPVFKGTANQSIFDAPRAAAENKIKTAKEAVDYASELTGKEFDGVDELKDYLFDKYNYSFSSNKQLLDFFNSAPNMSGSRANSKYLSLDDKIVDSFEDKISELHNDFLKNPTVKGAHELQSQFGVAVRKLEKADMKGTLDSAGRNLLHRYTKAQDALKDDIDSFLREKNPELADQYKEATTNWAKNVIPYLVDPSIRKLAKGEITNPESVANIFKNPEPETAKVVEDMGAKAKHQILYSELGKSTPNLTAEKLAKSFESLDNKGLGSYVTPELEKAADLLNKKIRNRDLLQRGAGLFAGAKAGIPIIPEAASALGGAILAPSAAKALDPLSQMLARLLRGTYPAISTTTKATVLPGAR